jgi:general secretion pathway protein E
MERRAREKGMASMYEDGLRKAWTGVTTLEEVMRVTSEVGG